MNCTPLHLHLATDTHGNLVVVGMGHMLKHNEPTGCSGAWDFERGEGAVYQASRSSVERRREWAKAEMAGRPVQCCRDSSSRGRRCSASCCRRVNKSCNTSSSIPCTRSVFAQEATPSLWKGTSTTSSCSLPQLHQFGGKLMILRNRTRPWPWLAHTGTLTVQEQVMLPSSAATALVILVYCRVDTLATASCKG